MGSIPVNNLYFTCRYYWSM